RVLSAGSLIERQAVTATLGGWTDVSVAPSTVGIAGQAVTFTGDGRNKAAVRQTLSVNEVGEPHGLSIRIELGPLKVRIGTAVGLDDLFEETVLFAGHHSFELTPTGDIFIEVFTAADIERRLTSISFDGPGAMELDSPFLEADLENIQYQQSGDTIFFSDGRNERYRLERRGANSWGLVTFPYSDGPFVLRELDEIEITPSGLSGNITLDASASLFSADDVGRLFEIRHSGQNVEADLTGDDQFTAGVKVTGVEEDRRLLVTREGTVDNLLTLQRSFDDGASWLDVKQYGDTGEDNYRDYRDNQEILYRVGYKTGDYGSGTATVSLRFAAGLSTGIVRITGFISETQVQAEVLESLGDTIATTNWYPGYFSNELGQPDSVRIYDGRLYYGTSTRWYGSRPNGFLSFEEDDTDAGAISRDVATGGVEQLYWLLDLQRLMIGTAGSVVSARTSSRDEPLTPFNPTLRDADTQGCADVPPIKIDSQGVYVQRDGWRLFQLFFDANSNDYTSGDMFRLHPYVGRPGIKRLAVQRQPVTRVFAVRTDGVLVSILYEGGEQVTGISRIVTDGIIEDVAVLPGTGSDEVYCVVLRGTNRTIERFQPELWETPSELVTLDGFTRIDSPSATLTGFDRFTDELVTVFAEENATEVAVINGEVANPFTDATTVWVGKPYPNGCKYVSSRMPYGAQRGSGLIMKRSIKHLSMILTDTSRNLIIGVRGKTQETLPDRLRGTTMDTGADRFDGDLENLSVEDDYETDSRVCLEMPSPWSGMINAIVVQMNVHER
ncbi:MAG: hypothetical protein AAGJ85_01415, partial [Pseudomonadota bacterium]